MKPQSLEEQWENRHYPNMKEKINPDNDGLDPSEEYFRTKNDNSDEQDQPYFPVEESKPPHY